MGYREGPNSTVTHRKQEYRVDDLIALAKSKPLEQLPVSELEWVLPHTKVNSLRSNESDLRIPIIVVKEPHKLVVLDGAHRLHKAIRTGVTELPAYVLQLSELPQPVR
jgi:hypothetical protein